MLKAYFIIVTPVKLLALFKKIRIYSGKKKPQLNKYNTKNIAGRREKGRHTFKETAGKRKRKKCGNG